MIGCISRGNGIQPDSVETQFKQALMDGNRERITFAACVARLGAGIPDM
jgi:hypothetical protein